MMDESIEKPKKSSLEINHDPRKARLNQIRESTMFT